MSNTPTIYIDDAVGNRLLVPQDWVSLDYVRVENDVGTLVLTLPAGDYARNLFYKDGLIEVWRTPDVGTPYLDTNTAWMIRRVKYINNPPATWEITAYDLNHILKRRVIDYNPGNTFTEKLAAADNMGKTLVSENLGAGATDTTRSIATYLSIQPNATAAPIIRKSVSRQNLLQALQDIAASSYHGGTYLVFDIVVSSLPSGTGTTLGFEFRSYTGQRGVDRTFGGTSPQVLFGPDFGNMSDAVYDEDASNEITRGISTGQGVDVIQAVARADDTAREAESPFALIESVRSASGALVAGDLLADAQAEVRAGIPSRLLTGKLVTTSNFQYGVDWNWGDILPAQVNGISQNVHVASVHVHYDRNAGETVEPTLVTVVP